MKYNGPNHEYFEMEVVTRDSKHIIEHSRPSELMLIWFESDDNVFEIDNLKYNFSKNDILCLTEFHQVKVKALGRARLIKWNNYFYCVINHDSEVGCKGILYYGATNLPIIHPNAEELNLINNIWNTLEREMASNDSLQLEMLQTTLKRLLVLCTRIYKTQTEYQVTDDQTADIIREYHFLVETYFKEKHSVQEYADMLHKSPKTLSNIFNKLGSKPPIQYIQDRKMVEARRLICKSDFTVSEISDELGFLDIQTFSRFFKRYEGVSPSQYKAEYGEGKIAN